MPSTPPADESTVLKVPHVMVGAALIVVGKSNPPTIPVDVLLQVPDRPTPLAVVHFT